MEQHERIAYEHEMTRLIVAEKIRQLENVGFKLKGILNGTIFEFYDLATAQTIKFTKQQLLER